MIEYGCSVAASGLIAWSLFAAISMHELEEFVWPGGFRAWYISYSPHVEPSMTRRFLVGINALILAAAALSAIYFTSPTMRLVWLAVGSAVGINGVWHLQATLRTRRYSPGVATGTLLYMPLVAYGFVHFVQCGWVSPRDALSAASYGAAYWIFSEGRKLLKRETRATRGANLSVLR
ncbi:MAG TPA: HXXEE domain-containing protein [Gemmatimonadaceae bacterium]|nr:HXXEE domain-containing protein [Gemmatimonadaceae bacterium]